MNRNHIVTAAMIVAIIAVVLYFHYGKAEDVSTLEGDCAAYIDAKGEGEAPPLPPMEINININQTIHDDSTQSRTAGSRVPTQNREYLLPVAVLTLLDIVIIAILVRHMLKKRNQ